MEPTPALILATWVAGLAVGGALVTWWAVVGPGYTWLVGAVVAGFGALAAAFGGDFPAWAGSVLAVAAAVVARNKDLSGALFATSAVAFVAAGLSQSIESSAMVASGVLIGAVYLGGVTSEMFLGHWFLVDPRLPRWALFSLDGVAGAGLVAEVLYVVAGGGFGSGEGLLVWAFVALTAMSALLIVGVWFSLKEPRYSGVMAATGLSYLAILTAFGVVVIGRSLVAAG